MQILTFCSPGNNVPDLHTSDILEFVKCAQICLALEDRVELVLYMEDGIKLRLRLAWKNNVDKHLHIQNLDDDWEVIIPRYMSPCFLKKSLEPFDIDPWTAALICDLANRICLSHHQSFYNWEHFVAQYVLEDRVPLGWDESLEAECEE